MSPGCPAVPTSVTVAVGFCLWIGNAIYRIPVDMRRVEHDVLITCPGTRASRLRRAQTVRADAVSLSLVGLSSIQVHANQFAFWSVTARVNRRGKLRASERNADRHFWLIQPASGDSV